MAAEPWQTSGAKRQIHSNISNCNGAYRSSTIHSQLPTPESLLASIQSRGNASDASVLKTTPVHSSSLYVTITDRLPKTGNVGQSDSLNRAKQRPVVHVSQLAATPPMRIRRNEHTPSVQAGGKTLFRLASKDPNQEMVRNPTPSATT
ncbi:hypothetical protein Nepgr_025351 [Nepenthes gracilis]|uniref:Uncharacterized protein n=1 Tax=Nepenthes gracilis TaxID=150966 RepID=A0AAD3T4K5_NEPGR|nr:hypothetical protein Nepgr_025351 [Nepenthes gracilis]